MIRLIKWDCIDFFKQHYWVIAAMAASLFLVVVPADGSGLLNSSMIMAAALLAFISFLAGIFLALTQCFRWLERDSALLDLSLPFSTSKILLAKLFVAAVLNTISLLFLLQFFVFTLKHSTGAIRLLALDDLRSIPLLVILLILLDSTFLVSYLVSKSKSKTNRFAWLFAGLLGFSMFTLITIGIVWTMKEAGMVSLPEITGENILTINGSLNIQSTWLAGCLGILAAALEHVVSSYLIRHRYQPN